MNSVRRIVKNSGASLIAQISTPATSFVLVFFIARLLGASGLGKYSTTISLLFIFQALASLGFPYLITREVARDNANAPRYLINASLLGGLFSVFTAAAMCVCGLALTEDPDTIKATYLLSISLIPYTIALVCQSICKGFERLEFFALPLVIGNCAKMLIGLLVLLKGYGLVELIVVIVLSHFLIFFLSLYFAIRCMPPDVHYASQIDLGFCRAIMMASPTFALISIFGTIRFNIDILMINKLMGDLDVGIYSAALKLVNFSKFGIICYLMALQPVIFRLFRSSRQKFERVCIESIRYLLMMILPIMAGITILSDRIVGSIFGREFLASGYALSILIWILILTGFNQLFANALVASGNQKTNLHATFLSMVMNIGLNLLLIPRMGYIGAALANVAAAVFNFGYQYYFISKSLFKLRFYELAKKPVVATVIMSVAVLAARDLNLLVVIVLSFLAYFAILVVAKAFTENDINLIRSVFSKKTELRI